MKKTIEIERKAKQLAIDSMKLYFNADQRKAMDKKQLAERVQYFYLYYLIKLS